MGQFDKNICECKAGIVEKLKDDNMIDQYQMMREKTANWGSFRYPPVEISAAVELPLPLAKKRKV